MAYIIDAILLAIVNFIVVAVLSSVGLYKITVNTNGTVDVNVVGLLLDVVISLAVSAAYFVYTWTTMRATIGMRLLSLQIGAEGSGATLTQDQAIRRWAFLAGPGALASVFTAAGGYSLGLIVELIVLVYYIALLVTTYQSPTKQGLHDQWAKTAIVKPTV